MLPVQAPRTLRDDLLAHGRQVVDLEEAARLLDLPMNAAADAMTRLRRAGDFFSPTPGLYVAIPPHYATWGVVPAVDFIDSMMSRLGRSYYVALLSAAELHGAAHQRPQVFQVMVDRQVSDRDFGRVRLRFYTHTRLPQVPTVLRNAAAGQIRVSSPETTAFDLAVRPNDSGGLSNVATVLAELAREGTLSEQGVGAVSLHYPLAASRRLGWLLDRVVGEVDTSALARAVERSVTARERAAGGTGRAVTLLDPSGPRRGPADPRWRVVVNTDVEPDL